jgi:hypothetical protein
LHETANNLQGIKQIWLRISSAAIFSLRCWSMDELQCPKDVAGADPELLLCVNERIKWTRNDYVADCKVFTSLMEVHFPRTSLSTNAHSDVCRAKYEMEMMGALLMELGIERTESYHFLLSIIMYFISC